jgi:HEAT repeat protein
MGLLKAQLVNLDANSTTSELNTEDLPMLLMGLTDTDVELRRMSAKDLGHYPEAAEALGNQLALEENAGVCESIFNSLERIGTEEAVHALLPLLRSERAFLRNAAIEVLRGLPQSVAPAMENLINDPDPDVRIFAVNVLESLRHPKVIEWLIDVMENDRHINVCATALDLLAEVGDESCLKAVAMVTDRFPDEPYLKFAVDMTIHRITEGKGAIQ